jgi:hypothetical protein
VLELAIVLAVVPELVIGPAVVLGLETAPVAALELGIGPAVALERELGPVAAELVLAQLAVALRTKSVTTAHRPDLVPLLTGEDLAAVAETPREPVAAEAAIAWAAAE